MKRKILNLRNFKKIQKFINKFSLNSFSNKKKVLNYMKFFELQYLLKKISEDKLKSKHEIHLRNVKDESKPYDYELSDLCRLHWIILKRKVFNALEFGSGYSTVFMSDAMLILKNYFRDVKNIRCEKKFHVYSMEESRHFLKLTKKRLTKKLSANVNLTHSKIDTINYQGKFASKYRNLPNISPDFIYLDGPSLYFTNKKFMNFSFKNISRFPMSADILFIEYFLEPGTFVLVDGRTANARFLKNFLTQKWKYKHDIASDCHYLELIEKPLGKYNKNKLSFCLGKKNLR